MKIVEGLKIVNKQNPEWGVWIVRRHYSEGMWDIDKYGSFTNGKCVCEHDLNKFWEKA